MTTQAANSSSYNIYFVTGAAGFIGSHLCRALLLQPDTKSVIGLDNINDYYPIKIKLRRIKDLSTNKKFIFYRGSVLNKKFLQSIVNCHKPNSLVHAAAEVGIRNGEHMPLQYYRTNVLGTLNTLSAVAPTAKHIIALSSSSVYGSCNNLPFREDEPITTLTPLSTYGSSKAAMEGVVFNFFNKYNIPTTIIRPFSVYGPDGRPDMLPMRLLVSAARSEHIDIYDPRRHYRDWTYIDDFVSSLLTIINNPHGFQIINIGNGKSLRLDQVLVVAQKIINKHGRSVHFVYKPPNAVEMLVTCADISKYKNLYGSLHTTSFAEGFSITADYFFSHTSLYI